MSHNSDLASITSPLALTIPPPLTEHPAAVYLAGLGAGSRRTMREALDTIARLLTNGRCDHLTLDWAALRYKHTAALRAALLKKYSPATANKMLGGLRRVLKEALRLELIDPLDYARAVDLRGVKVTLSLRGRALSETEIVALMEVCFNDPQPTGARDAALFALLRGSGVRRTEAVNLNLSDLNRDTGALAVRQGKGRKDRTVYLPPSAVQVLENWLRVRGRVSGPLLTHVRKGGTVVLRRLTSQSVLFLLSKRAAEAGVAPLSPHDFRRSFISDLLDAGIDMVTVQKLAGHQDPATTSRYDRRGEEALRRAVSVLHVPTRS